MAQQPKARAKFEVCKMSNDTLTAEIQDTYALTYRDGSAFYFIPTSPRPANKWRGPFPNEPTMQRAMHDELGENIIETRTIVRPGFLMNSR
jgi:hypothetical protein